MLKPELIQNGDTFHSKLYSIKGKRTPVVKEMPKISWEYLTSSGIYLILIPKTIFIWIGRATTSTEKLKATEVSKIKKKSREFG